RLEFDFTGTDDPTPFLCVPAAIRCLEGLLPGGFDALRAHNRDLALRGRDRLHAVLGVEPICPDDRIGSLASVRLPAAAAPTEHGVVPLQRALFARHRIEVPVMTLVDPKLRLLRISPQAYNSPEQFEYLAGALRQDLAADQTIV